MAAPAQLVARQSLGARNAHRVVAFNVRKFRNLSRRVSACTAQSDSVEAPVTASQDVEMQTPEAARAAMELDLGSVVLCSIQLICLQVIMGFGERHCPHCMAPYALLRSNALVSSTSPAEYDK
jgi:hypothetical protein